MIKKANTLYTIGNKSYIIVALLIIVFFLYTDSNSYTYLISALGGLLAIFAIDNYMLFSKRYPYIWQVIKWCALLAIILLTLIGSSIL